jgi:hypothetical protein
MNAFMGRSPISLIYMSGGETFGSMILQAPSSMHEPGKRSGMAMMLIALTRIAFIGQAKIALQSSATSNSNPLRLQYLPLVERGLFLLLLGHVA